MAYTYKDHLTVIKGFCDKSDGKDKLTALIQYACMFISAGEPGNVKKIQASVTAARKIFRVMRPLESLTPVLITPGWQGDLPKAVQAINKAKNILMALYFGADHVVWAYQIGLISDKKVGDRYQKLSLWSWAIGSVCTIAAEGWQAALVSNLERKKDESDEAYAKRKQQKLEAHMFLIVHALFQTALAMGLLQQLPLKPRTVGLIGVIASAMNCYNLLPTYPKKAPAPAPMAVAAGDKAKDL